MEGEKPDSMLDPRAEEAQAILDACGDDMLVRALPQLLTALPEDAKERCMLTLRDVLSEELHGGSLAGDDNAHATWQRALGPAKKLVRAMAAPFVTAPAAASAPSLVPATVATPPSVPTNAIQEKLNRWAAELDEECGVEPSAEDPVTLYIANVPYKAVESEIQAFLQPHCSPGHVKAVRLLLGQDGAPKGACIVTFDTTVAASRVMQLNGKPGLEGRILMVREDTRGGAKGGRGKGKGRAYQPDRNNKEVVKGANGRLKRPFAAIIQKNRESEVEQRSVIVKNLDFGATDADLGELFAGCGGLAAVRIAKEGRKSKGFAVVELADVDSLEEALARNGREIRGRPVRVEALSASAETQADIGTENVTLDSTSHTLPAKHSSIGTDGGAVDVVEAIRVALEPVKFVKAGETSITDSPTCTGPLEKRHRNSIHVQMTTCAGGDFLGGDAGLVAVHKLLEAHSSPEDLLQAEGADAIKSRLAALGLKAGGSPVERATRLYQLRSIASLVDVPKALLVKASRGPASQAPTCENPAVTPAGDAELMKTPTMAATVEVAPSVIVAD